MQGKLKTNSSSPLITSIAFYWLEVSGANADDRMLHRTAKRRIPISILGQSWTPLKLVEVCGSRAEIVCHCKEEVSRRRGISREGMSVALESLECEVAQSGL